jgi:hypothetical protein
VCAENGKMVEYDQPLFLVAPATAGEPPENGAP